MAFTADDVRLGVLEEFADAQDWTQQLVFDFEAYRAEPGERRTVGPKRRDHSRKARALIRQRIEAVRAAKRATKTHHTYQAREAVR